MNSDGHTPEAEPAEEANRFVAHAVPRIADLGIRVVELAPDRIVAHAPLQTNGNHLVERLPHRSHRS